MPVTVKFVTEVCEVEFSDEIWEMIELAAIAENQSTQDWINSTISSYLQKFDTEDDT